jgi:hypothetical protein
MIINWINKKVNQFKQDSELERKRIESEREIEIQNKRNELIDLRRITIGNVMYINSYINTLNSNLNSAKGNSAAETKRKRIWIRSKMEWLANKLTEENAMFTYYDNLIKSQ